MAKLEVLKYPNPFLKKKVNPIDINQIKTFETVISDMIETMYHAKGIGLAATQVGIDARIFVMDLSDNSSDPVVFINPEIIKTEGEVTYEEGCLSFPGIFTKVKRAEKVTVSAYDRNGERFEIDAHGLQAICIQHETDHLNGITFFDHLSPLKRQLAEKKFNKLQKVDV
ncbi:peptide deformylase [Thiotrichales bacterium 19S11-10]|nr:peptide deformylase [Thiotrichales bacterium 19S11-10]MCF6807901.1 peptide deformylase [Thiotrichales bacterium 19S9-11]MCF6811915.1 peptide deformylase [Thiotrichales bacterium 19S9-12]